MKNDKKYQLFKNFLWECHQSFPSYYCDTIWTKEEFKKRINHIEKQTKGKSKYDNTVLVSDYLVKGQEFYVLLDDHSSDETGLEAWEYVIAVALDDYNFFVMTDCGSN